MRAARVVERLERAPSIAAVVTNGRSIGRTTIAVAPPATTSARASREAGVEAARPLAEGPCPERRPRGARTSRSGLTTSTSSSRSTARAATTVRARNPSTRSCRSSASSGSPRRDLAPSSGADRDDRRDRMARRRQSAANSSTARAEPGAAGGVGHDRVGDEGPQPERGDRRLEGGVDRVEDEGVDDGPRSCAATPRALDSNPSEVSIRSAGPLSATPPTMPLTAMTGTPRDRASAIARRHPGTARIGPIETIGFDGPMTMTSAAASAASTSAVGLGASIAVVADLADLGPWWRWTKYSWKSSQPSSIRTWVRTGSSAIGRIAVGMPSARLERAHRRGQRPALADPCRPRRCGSRSRGRRGGTRPPRRTRRGRPSRSRSRRRGPSRGRGRSGRRACT